jgi:hypothetical protein
VPRGVEVVKTELRPGLVDSDSHSHFYLLLLRVILN